MFRWRLLHFLEDEGYAILEAENGMAGIKPDFSRYLLNYIYKYLLMVITVLCSDSY